MRFKVAQLGMMTSLFWLAACSGADSASDEGGPASESQSEELAQSEKRHPGEAVFIQCAACHALDAGQGHKLGPNLAGVLGRKAGTAEGFGYSDAMVASGVEWNRENLDAFLASPNTVVPGTTMIFAGIGDEERRTALIDYLEKEAGNSTE